MSVDGGPDAGLVPEGVVLGKSTADPGRGGVGCIGGLPVGSFPQRGVTVLGSDMGDRGTAWGPAGCSPVMGFTVGDNDTPVEDSE